MALVAERDEKIAALTEENSALRHNVEVFRRMLFGPSSEKRSRNQEDALHPLQAHLFAADLLAEAERAAKDNGASGSIDTKAPTPRKKGRRRTRFPDHLPHVRTRYELPEEQRICRCGGPLHEIGTETTRELERIEVSIVHEIERAKYACRQCEDGVTTAPGPDRVIEKGLLGPGFLAHVATEHFGNHMPYHRLEKKYATEGLELSRSVLERSMARCAELLEPIWREVGKDVVRAPALHTDDTTVTIARGSRGKSRQGRMWIYLDQEGRHYYDFTESRARDGPLAVLTGYKGFIHADAYTGYDALFIPECATEVACWAHARRKFIEAESTEPELATEATERIGALYGIERVARAQGMDAEARLALRQERSVPLLEDLGAWLAGVEAKVLPKSPLAKAVKYVRNQWAALKVYTTDGRLSIDNNAAERAMRPVAVGRKNWLFVQSLEGGQRAAILLSLVMTAKSIGLNPLVYLRDVLVRLSRETDVAKLTPHGWKEHHATKVSGEREAAIAKLMGR